MVSGALVTSSLAVKIKVRRAVGVPKLGALIFSGIAVVLKTSENAGELLSLWEEI
jgi:hypothetical protein